MIKNKSTENFKSLKQIPPLSDIFLGSATSLSAAYITSIEASETATVILAVSAFAWGATKYKQANNLWKIYKSLD